MLVRPAREGKGEGGGRWNMYVCVCLYLYACVCTCVDMCGYVCMPLNVMHVQVSDAQLSLACNQLLSKVCKHVRGGVCMCVHVWMCEYAS